MFLVRDVGSRRVGVDKQFLLGWNWFRVRMEVGGCCLSILRYGPDAAKESNNKVSSACLRRDRKIQRSRGSNPTIGEWGMLSLNCEGHREGPRSRFLGRRGEIKKKKACLSRTCCFTLTNVVRPN